MATAKKLPSGSYRVRVFDYQDEDGKKHYKSFTAPTKKAAELLALEYKNGKCRNERGSITVSDAVRKYIDIKEPVLSEATIRGYERMYRNNIQTSDVLAKKKVSDIDEVDLQILVSDYSKNYSAKTVKNIWGLLLPAIVMFRRGFDPDITLPEGKQKEIEIPDEGDMKKIFSELSKRETNEQKELELAVYLAAFGPMRRGEICALTVNDVKGKVVTVNKDMIKDKNDCWVIKDRPKTHAGNRKIEFPDYVIDKITAKEGRIMDANPDEIYHRWLRFLRSIKVRHYSFHSLRHYGASIMSAIGVSEQVIMDRGGWSTANTMKRIYRHQITEETRRQTDIIMDKFNQYKPE